MAAFTGTTGDDFLMGGIGNDTLAGGLGNDTLKGGPGNDIASGDAGDDFVFGGAGADTLTGGDGNDFLQGFGDTGQNSGTDPQNLDGADSIDGGAGDDVLRGNSGNDTLLGGAGNDNLRGDAGNDSLDGGDGLDSAGYRFDELGLTNGINFNASVIGSGPATVQLSDGQNGTDTLTSIEFALVLGSNFADTLTGSQGGDQIIGGSGNDSIKGGAGDDFNLDGGDGNDTILGGAGADAMFGGAGNDYLQGFGDTGLGSGKDPQNLDRADYIDGGDGDDVLRGNSGNDTLLGGAGNDNLRGDAGNDSLDGGDGLDGAGYRFDELGRTSGVNFDASVIGTAVTVQITDERGGTDTLTSIEFVIALGTDYADTLTGSQGGDQLVGGAGDDSINGGAGADFNLNGGAGNDTILGGAGDDVLVGDLGNDSLDGGDGIDGAVYQFGDIGLTSGLSFDASVIGSGPVTVQIADAHLGTDTLTSIEFVNIEGTDFADTLIGSHGSDQIFGAAGNDSINGGEGSDTLEGGAGNDSLDGGTGADAAVFSFDQLVQTTGVSFDASAIGGTSPTAQITSALGTDALSSIESVIAFGTSYADTLIGSQGGDQLVGGFGNDAIDGGAGNDANLEGDDGNDTIAGGAGADTLYGGAGDDLLLGYISPQSSLDPAGLDGADFIDGGDGNDVLRGLTGNDTLLGGAGNDNLRGDAGNDSLDGGDGVDTAAYRFDDLSSGINFTGAVIGTAATLQFADGRGGMDTLTSIESFSVLGSNFADTLVGSQGGDILSGGAGDDSINGGAGNDTIRGDAGNDTLDGGDGIDRANFSGNAADFTITRNGNGSFTVTDTRTVDNGGLGTDTVINIETLGFVDKGINLTTQFYPAQDSIPGSMNNITGTLFGDNIDADALDTANGVSGNQDWIDGREGNDTILGGAGNDGLQGGAGNDILDGGAGFDGARYVGNAADFTITRNSNGGFTVADTRTSENGGLGTDTLTNIETLNFNDIGISLIPSFYANHDPNPWATNSITGTQFDDSINADALDSDPANGATVNGDWIDGREGNDTIHAGLGRDFITGGAGNDIVDGGESSVLARLNPALENPWYIQNQAQFSGLVKRYSITQHIDTDGSVTGTSGTGYFTIADLRLGSPDGTDILYSIDSLNFSDTWNVRLTPEFWFNKDAQSQVTGVNTAGTSFEDVIGQTSATLPSGTYNFAGSDFLQGNAGNDTLYGGAGGDTLRGDVGNDRLDGGANTAISNSSTQTWEPNGWNGVDVAVYSGKAERYTITKLTDSTTGTVTGTPSGAYYTVTDNKAGGDGQDTLISIEVLRFSDGDKNLEVVKNPMFNWTPGSNNTPVSTLVGMNWTGTDWGDNIDTAASEAASNQVLNDNVQGGAGNDDIKTGGGADNIDAGEGNDTVDGGDNGTGNNYRDVVHYDAAQSRFSITRNGDGSFTVKDLLPDEFGGFGTDTLTNIEALSFSDTWKDLQISFNGNDGQGNSQNNIQGTDFADTIDADALAIAAGVANRRDYINPGSGNDVVYAGAGGDTIQDGMGDDFYDGGANGTGVNSWENQDQISFNGAQKRYMVDVLTYAQAPDSIKTLIGSKYSGDALPTNVVRVTDKLPGGDGVNYLINVEQINFADNGVSLGVNANPWVMPSNFNGYPGTNNYNGGILGDRIDASTHDLASPTNNTVPGFNSNNDWIDGGLGNDTLIGGAGSDHLMGGRGDDVLEGGADGVAIDSNNMWQTYDEARFNNSINRYDISFFRPVKAGETALYNDMGLTSGTKAFVASQSYDPNGFIVVQDRYSDAMGGDGRDVLRNIETLAFSDAYEALKPQINDFSGSQQEWNSAANNYVSVPVDMRNAWGSRFGDLIEGGLNRQNNLNGNAGNDVLVGGNLRDDLSGGSGNDTLDGGANPAANPARPWDTWNYYDTAHYEAPKSQFKIDRLTDDASGTVTGHANQVYYQVEHLIPSNLGGLGTDIVFNIERLQFSDGDIQLDVRVDKTSDSNGDHINYNGTVFADNITGTTLNEYFRGDAGDDTIHGGAGDDGFDAGTGNDSLFGDAGNDWFNSLSSGDDTVDGGADYDTVAYDDSLARFTIKLVRNGTEYAFVKATGFGTTFDPTTDLIKITDSLANTYGGEGTDTLKNVERVNFSDGYLDLSSGGNFQANSTPAFVPDSTLTVNRTSDAVASLIPTLSVSATVQVSDNTYHSGVSAIAGSSAPILHLFGNDVYAFNALDKGTGTVTLGTNANIVGYIGSELRFEFGDLELSKVESGNSTSTETWTDTDSGPAYFKLYGRDQLIATGSDLKVEATINTSTGAPTAKVTVTLHATPADQGFVQKIADAQNGSTTIILNENSFSSAAPSSTRSADATWEFTVAGQLDQQGFNLLPVWDQWSRWSSQTQNFAPAPVFRTGSTGTVDLPVLAADPEGATVYYQAYLGYAGSSGFTTLSGTSEIPLSVVDHGLSGSFTVPAVSDPNLVMRVYAYDDSSSVHTHGSYIDIPLVIVPAGTNSISGRSLIGTDGNDWINGGSGNDLINGGKGDDGLQGGAGNDTLVGGADTASSGANPWGGGDRAQYNAARDRFDIVKNGDGSFTVIDIASVITPEIVNGHLVPASYTGSGTVSGEIGFGVDTLVGIEHLQFNDSYLDLAPIDSSWTYRSSWWDGTQSVSYDVTRHNITGTFANDLLLGTSYGDQIDGRAGNDTIDGGVETQTIGNPWEIQDVVRYEGSRERYIIKGVLVSISGSGTSATYSIVDPTQATSSSVFGLQVTDLLPAANGGSGQDLLVNVERIDFAAGANSNNSILVKPELNYYQDWSSPAVKDNLGVVVKDGNGIDVHPTAVNARGTDFDDVLNGTPYGDWLSGGGGNDTLVGGTGGDNLEGGSGDDLLLGGANGVLDQWDNVPLDSAHYNAPFERFQITSVKLTLNGIQTDALQVKDLLPADDSSSQGTDTLVDVESLSFNNRWVDVTVRRWQWTDPQNPLNVNANAEGTVFDDVIYGDRNTDGTTSSTPHNDYIRGNAGNDVLIGGGGGDNLQGGEGNDVIDGGANGTTGNSWQDQDQVRFTGNASQYAIQSIVISTVGGTSTVYADSNPIATFNGTALTITDSNLSAAATAVLQNAYKALNLADGQHNAGYLVTDNLASDLGGEGTDLVFNVETLWFANGPVEVDMRVNANDWNNDGTLDWVNVTGTARDDTVNMAKLVALSGKTAAELTATRIDGDLREGNDIYIGGSGGDAVRTGAGNDYVDGGANTGKDPWGNEMRDEVRFDGKFSRYNLIDVALNKSGSNWTLTSSALGLTAASTTLASSNLPDALSALLPSDLNAAIATMITQAGSQSSVTGWLVADRLPAAFQGTGVDALVNVEALSFSDRWIPLNMQIYYQRDFTNPDPAILWETRPILSAYVDGTQRADVIGYSSSAASGTYNYTGDDNLRGNDGNDTIYGGSGGDWISGGAGDDVINGGSNGSVDQWGNTRVDTVQYSGDFSRYVITGNSNGSVTVQDTLVDGDGTDTLTNVEAVSFNDRYVGLTVDTWVNKDINTGRINDIQVNGSLLADSIDISTDAYPGIHHYVRGNEGNDTLVGGAGPDDFEGGLGDDSIVGGANGTDTWGNPGYDVAHYQGVLSRYTIEYSSDGVTWGSTKPAGSDTWVRVTDSFSTDDGGQGVDILQGIEALAFYDRFMMLQATKRVFDLNGDGRPDNSEIIGTEAADTLVGDDATNDHILGNGGNDTISGGKGGDRLNGGAGNDVLNGGDDGTDIQGRPLVDVAEYANAFSLHTITKNNDGSFTVSSTAEGTDTLTNIEGLQFSDRYVSLQLTVNEMDLNKDGIVDMIDIHGLDLVTAGDTVAPATGKEGISHRIFGGEGNDTLSGGTAADVFIGGAGNDSISGGAGIDRAVFSGNSTNYVISPSLDNINSGTTITVTGADGTDTLYSVEELAFNDKVIRLGAAAVVKTIEVDTNGDKKVDTAYTTGTDGNDTINFSNSTLINFIDSGAGNDSISGGSGADTFTPGTGNDTVVGGANEGQDESGNPHVDRVILAGNKADYDVNSMQAASFTISGAVEVGDVVSITVGSTTVSYTATATTLATLRTGFDAAIVAGALTATSVLSHSNTQIDYVLTTTNALSAVSAAATNGTHAVGTGLTVNGASQSGKSLNIYAPDSVSLTAGMHIRYTVDMNGDGDTIDVADISDTYTIKTATRTAVDNAPDKWALTLTSSIGASPANSANVLVTSDNTDTTLSTGSVSYDRWFEVALKSSPSTNTDTLRQIEQLVFDNGVTNLSFRTSEKADFGDHGIEKVTQYEGSDLADVIRSDPSNEILFGGAGVDHFVFSDNNGKDKIRDFVAGAAGDRIVLVLGASDTDGINGTGVDTASEALARATQQGNNVMIDLGSGNSIMLLGVRVDDLVAANFEVAPTF